MNYLVVKGTNSQTSYSLETKQPTGSYLVVNKSNYLKLTQTTTTFNGLHVGNASKSYRVVNATTTNTTTLIKSDCNWYNNTSQTSDGFIALSHGYSGVVSYSSRRTTCRSTGYVLTGTGTVIGLVNQYAGVDSGSGTLSTSLSDTGLLNKSVTWISVYGNVDFARITTSLTSMKYCSSSSYYGGGWNSQYYSTYSFLYNGYTYVWERCSSYTPGWAQEERLVGVSTTSKNTIAGTCSVSASTYIYQPTNSSTQISFGGYPTTTTTTTIQ